MEITSLVFTPVKLVISASPMPWSFLAFVNNKFVATIQQFLDAPDTVLFPSAGDDAFLRECGDRERQLKGFLNVCWGEIQNHLETPSLSQSELTGWRKAKIDNNLKNLCGYFDELVLALQKGKIEQYVSDQKRSKPRRLPFEPNPFALTLSSYYGTVLGDQLLATLSFSSPPGLLFTRL
jgi:hypothetical protein